MLSQVFLSVTETPLKNMIISLICRSVNYVSFKPLAAVTLSAEANNRGLM